MTFSGISHSSDDEMWKKETSWLSHVNRLLTDEASTSDELNISWAGFHASRDQAPKQISINALLPLFNEKSTSPGMVRHVMDLIGAITLYLNKDQIPVVCGDQPLFTMAKIVQWNWPEIYGERKFVILFAPFHIEQGFLKVLGQFMEGSGWLSIVSGSGITTTGSAESLMKVT